MASFALAVIAASGAAASAGWLILALPVAVSLITFAPAALSDETSEDIERTVRIERLLCELLQPQV